MKIQRPRGDADRRPALDSNGNSNSSDGSPQGEADSSAAPQQASMKAVPPPLPKRKVSKQSNTPAGNGKAGVMLDAGPQSAPQRVQSAAPVSQSAEPAAVPAEPGGWRAYVTYETVFYV